MTGRRRALTGPSRAYQPVDWTPRIAAYRRDVAAIVAFIRDHNRAPSPDAAADPERFLGRRARTVLASRRPRFFNPTEWAELRGQIVIARGPVARASNDTARRANFTDANRRRSATAAERSAAAARTALAALPPDADPAVRRVLRARADNPAASLPELAALLGMTKDAYASRLRRALGGHR